MDAYDQLHVVSDLHLGGPPDRQVNNQGAALAGVIDYLTAQPSSQRIGLVLNGDIVDYLAVPNAAYLDPKNAVSKFLAVRTDPAFSPVFDALGRFVKQEGRTLVVALGNHDLELGLPDVQVALVQELTQGDALARSRIILATHGTGYPCTVGGERVLCLHGNEADAWNIVEHEELRRIAQAENRGNTPDPWMPNAGTRLVIDVMNGIKARYPFVDLLKPETPAVPQVLLALPTDYSTSLGGFAKALLRREYDAARLKTNMLGDDEVALKTSIENEREALDRLIRRGPLPGPAEAAGKETSGDALSRMAAFAKGERVAATTAVRGDLDMKGLLIDRLFGKDPIENLRDALKVWIGDTHAFDVDGPCAIFGQLDQMVAPEVQYLVAGHTHLQRRLQRKRGRGVYYNSGTWIRLLRLTPAMLADKASFEPYFKVLGAHTLDEIDAAKDLVLQRRTIVAIEVTPAGVRGELRNALAREEQDASKPPWTTVPGSSSV